MAVKTACRCQSAGARLSPSASFGDDQIADAVDHPHLPLKNKGGGVELGDDGKALNARAGTETLTRIKRGFFCPAFQEHGARTPAGGFQGRAGRQLVEPRRWKDALGVDPQGDELNGRVLLGKGVKALMQPMEGGNGRRRRGLGYLVAAPGDREFEALVLVAQTGVPKDASRRAGDLLLIEPGTCFPVQGSENAGDLGGVEGPGFLQAGAGELRLEAR